MMNRAKERYRAIHAIHRILRSIYWYARLRVRNAGIDVGQAIRDQIGNVDNVHIVCPGPSAVHINNVPLANSSLVILVNHAVAMSTSETLRNIHKICFSADPLRADELVRDRLANLRECTSVLMPGHLFHLNENITKHYQHIYTPRLTFSSQYGLISRAVEPENISAPVSRYVGYGFGSLPASIIFSLLFTPKRIHFWGCDFGKVGGQQYSHSNIQPLGTTPYQRIRVDIDRMQKEFAKRNIEFIFHNTL